ncbi:unnamed protein product [Meloidogyne enterolobii]|uniref:Uncharacterized protein n=1 Tax=Meloidogyne enterolobii TaxID=390850 RepID=A0ACB0YNW0_MELEN
MCWGLLIEKDCGVVFSRIGLFWSFREGVDSIGWGFEILSVSGSGLLKGS